MSEPVLIVDMDGTYLKNDFTLEAFAQQLLSRPCTTLWRWVSSSSLVQFKTYLLESVTPDGQVLDGVMNRQVVEWLKANRDRFASVHLVSATPDGFVQRVFDELDSDFIFDSITGSKEVNLKGVNKLEYIKDRFGSDFWYMGDSKADEVIFEAAAGAIRSTRTGLKHLKGALH